VILDDHIIGQETGILRQIDVSIRSKIAGHDILIIIQAKEHKKRADINMIGEFDSVVRDVKASKGILICNSGFTKTAKEYAQRLKVDLCTAHDASNINWQTEVKIPVIKKSITVGLKFQHHYVVVGTATIEGMHVPFPDLAFQKFLEKWESDEISKEPGVHYLPLEREDIQYHKDLMPVRSGIEYHIIHRHHFKSFTPIDYRGIKDFITEKFTPSFMAFSEKIPFLNDGTWKFVNDPKEISLKTLHLNIEILNISFLKKKMIRFIWGNAD
jgi:Restriction endonuclease